MRGEIQAIEDLFDSVQIEAIQSLQYWPKVVLFCAVSLAKTREEFPFELLIDVGCQ